MNKKLIDNLIKNWPAKVICFVIAIFLYLFYQASLIEKKTFTIPLDVVENGLVVHIGDLPSAVVVSVRASENDIKSIFPADIKASINLNNIVSSGTYRVPIDIKISDKLMGMDPLELKVKEEKIKVIAERRISSFVKIVPSIVGEVSENYEISAISVSPSYVQVDGPESIVKEIKEVSTDKVNVSNAKTNFSTTTTLNDICDLVRIREIKDEYKVTISVSPKIVEKVFENVPMKTLNLMEGLEVSNIQPAYNLKLKGSIPDFNRFNILKNPVKIDLSDVMTPGEYEIPVNLSVPDGIELIEKSGDAVFVTVVEKKKEEDVKLPEVQEEEKIDNHKIPE